MAVVTDVMVRLPEAETPLGMGEKLQSLWNTCFYTLRQMLRWQRPGYREKAQDKSHLFHTEANLKAREADLSSRYNLSVLQEKATQLRYRENLAMLQSLAQIFQDTDSFKDFSRLYWLDVGSKNGAYLEALYRFIEAHTSGDFVLRGLELDAFRLYRDFHSRWDYAQSYIRHLPRVTFEAGDVMHYEGCYEVVSCFLPFVFAQPCLAWGLPLSAFSPFVFLEKLYHLLAPGGYLILVNQGEAEAIEQERLLHQLQARYPHLEIEWQGELTPLFLPYRYPRFGWRCRKGT